jgi:hypothetical protein
MVTRRTFLGLDVRRHPWLAGQMWAALFCPCMIVLELLKGQLPLARLPALTGLCVLGGVAFGAMMSILAKSAANREEG